MASDIDPAAADRLLTTTRAVRRRLDLERPVDRSLLLECIGVAQQAPTAGNGQTWSFVVVTDARKRARIAELYRAAATTLFEAARARARETGDEQTAKAYDGALHLAGVLDRVPVHVLPCIRGRIPDGSWSNAAAAGMYGSILPAAWSFMLAARARGLGTAWTSIHLLKEREVAEVLGIPEGVTQTALIPVAHYTGEGFSPAARPPAETVTHWDGWSG
ncbi:nitroreductase family protein [Trujillonella endophytica]|uniref:Nitroreductase n=1 Tax=Trujillonella endophytica TaxID=673521 RepID=A0A1H8SGL5_9ACTN|nr:nitroreductase family protein [Trujillella endophytica]SEO77494.1 Nitroreductase [Trujillella endophytica]